MANRPILANSCAMAATAAEARYRIDAKPQAPRSTSVVALDDGAMAVVRQLAGQQWHAARFLGLPGGTPAGEYADLQLRTVDGEPVRLFEELAEADFVMMVATEGRGAAAAATIGDACTLRGIMTAGLIVGTDVESGPALTALRPNARGGGGVSERSQRERASGTVSPERVTLADLARMKREGRKIVGVVAWDYQIARIVDRVGVEIVSVGDTVGMNLWGQTTPFEVTLDQMVTVCQAVRRGVRRALVSGDFPYGPLQEGPAEAVRAAIRLVKEAGVDLVKLDGAADHLDAVRAVDRAGIPVFAQLGVTPQAALRLGLDYAAMARPGAQVPDEMAERLVAEAKALEQAGAALLDFTNSGPVVGAEVARSVSIPVLGGFGGGPWLDGRVRMAHAAIGYAAAGLDDPPDTYADVAHVAFDALSAYAADVRGARQIRGGIPVPP